MVRPTGGRRGHGGKGARRHVPIDCQSRGVYALSPADNSSDDNVLILMNLESNNPPRAPRSRIVTPPFVVAVLILGSAAILAGPVAARLDFRAGKTPVPLRTPLFALDEEALFPYVVLAKRELEPVVIEALGTPHYLAWRLEDTTVESTNSARFADLFVTYYSGGGNLVPHTPDVCYLGNGYNPSQAHENTDLALPRLGAEVPVRVCSFIKTAIFDSDETTVVYTFHCNGRFVNTRTDVRILINDPTREHAYFAKIEVSFPRAGRAEAVEAARKLLDRVLPVLVKEHFPDVEATGDPTGA